MMSQAASNRGQTIYDLGNQAPPRAQVRVVPLPSGAALTVGGWF